MCGWEATISERMSVERKNCLKRCRSSYLSESGRSEVGSRVDTWGRAFLAETLRWAFVWQVHGAARRTVWLEGRGRAGGRRWSQ